MGHQPIRIESRVKNNILWHCIYDNHVNATRFSKKYGFTGYEVLGLLNISISPFKHVKKQAHHKEYREVAIGLATFFHMEPEELFPEELYRSVTRTKIVHEVSLNALQGHEGVALNSGLEDKIIEAELKTAIETVLDTLSDRRATIVRGRMAGATFEELGFELNVTRERVRQIYRESLRLLRHPRNAKILKEYHENI